RAQHPRSWGWRKCLSVRACRRSGRGVHTGVTAPWLPSIQLRSRDVRLDARDTGSPVPTCRDRFSCRQSADVGSRGRYESDERSWTLASRAVPLTHVRALALLRYCKSEDGTELATSLFERANVFRVLRLVLPEP